MDVQRSEVAVVDDDPPTVICAGELDLPTIELVLDAVLEVADSHCGRIVVDLRPATFIGPAALSRLATEVRRCQEAGVIVEVAPGPFSSVSSSSAARSTTRRFRSGRAREPEPSGASRR